MRRRRWSVGFVLVWVLAGLGTLSAIYRAVETRKVPVARLIGNLERKLAENPQSAMAHINLGRLHGMAFALKTEEVPAAVRPGQKPGEDEEQPWYGYDPKLIPYPNRPAPTAEAAAAARVHLDKALEHYTRALELEPNNLLARLGYGWMLEQSGNKEQAIDQYRRVIDTAWPNEREKRMRLPSQNFFTREAIDYLIPLLDLQKDAAEIAALRERAQTLDRLPRAITPIAVPLRDHVPAAAIHDASARVRFDADGSGIKREWSWLGDDAAWLVSDTEGRGEIASALQLFGNVTFWLFWSNGYQALEALDDDDSGAIEGEELVHLGLWTDRNRNGASDRGEVRSLASHGIAALSCSFDEGDGIEFAAVSREGVVLTSGRKRPTYDVILRSGRSLTLSRTPDAHRVILQDRARQQE